jgi:hypothetical protein
LTEWLRVLIRCGKKLCLVTGTRLTWDSFYVDSFQEAETQKLDYIYNGTRLKDVRQSLPQMLKASAKVKEAVNSEIQRRTKEKYDGRKLNYQSPDEWAPNCSFVNCYDGGKERYVSTGVPTI